MVIAALITWPVVVFGGAKGKKLHYSSDHPHEDYDPGDAVDSTSAKTDDGTTFGKKNAMDTGPFTKSVGDDEQDLKFELKGDKYECECVHQPLERRELFHYAF